MCPALSAVDPYLPLIGPILPPPNGETRPGRASVIAQYQEGRGAGYGGIRRRWGLLTSVLKQEHIRQDHPSLSEIWTTRPIEKNGLRF